MQIAFFCDAFLRVASLRYAFLRVDYFCDASLHYAFLRVVYLRYAFLRVGYLCDASLRYAFLRVVYLRDAFLCCLLALCLFA